MDEQLPFAKPGERLEGDREVALGHLPAARKLLFHVRRVVANSLVPIFAATRKLPDGSTIHASMIDGVGRVRVFGAAPASDASSEEWKTERRRMRFWGTVNLGAISGTGSTTDRVGFFSFTEDLTGGKHLGIYEDCYENHVIDSKVWWRHSVTLSSRVTTSFTMDPADWGSGYSTYTYSAPYGTAAVIQALNRGDTAVLAGTSVLSTTGPTLVNLGWTYGDRFDHVYADSDAVMDIWYEYHKQRLRVAVQARAQTSTFTYYYGGGSESTPAVGSSTYLYYAFRPSTGLTDPVSFPDNWYSEVALPSVTPVSRYVVGYLKSGFIAKALSAVTGVGSTFVEKYDYGNATPVAVGKVPNYPFFAAYPKPGNLGATGQAYTWWYVCTYKFMILWWFGADKRIWLGRLKYGADTFEKVVALDTIVSPMDGHPVDSDRWRVVNVDAADIK